MLLRMSAARRFTLVTLLAAAALVPLVFAARLTRHASQPNPPVARAGEAAPAAEAAQAQAAPTPGLAPPTPAASVQPAVPCGPCDDADPCTVDRCDTQTGQCVHPPVVCDDLSPCTNDSCEPGVGCRYDPVPEGSVCGTPEICETARTCQAGLCVGTPLDCDDGDACTADFCQGGQCGHQVNSCDDGNPCTADACDPQTGGCHRTFLPVGAACDDGNPCTVAGACVDTGMGVQCVGTPAPGQACDDANPCTLNDRCLDYGPGSSYCEGTPRPCGDGDACTQDYCDYATGQCAFYPLSCDDRNPCTEDVCDPVSGCASTPLPDDSSCDDLRSCTIDDRCTFGGSGFNCYGTPTLGAACDDGNPCSTGDTCMEQFGNIFCWAPPIECGDGNSCTTDFCHGANGCISMPVHCNDGNSCTVDACSPATGGCEYQMRPDGVACDDRDGCSTGEICQGGFCSGATPVSCDDQADCTVDSCDVKTGACRHATTNCDDGNPCTDDSCPEPGGGCVHAPRPDGSACSDQTACTLGETCQAGQCTGTPVPPCDDGNPCTNDVCDPATGGCLSLPISCTDYDACTTDTCDPATGQCGHAPISCDDGNACTTDACQPWDGVCTHVPDDGSACDDGDACTEGTVCNAGACGGGTTLTCDDNNTCTQDTCDPATGCESTPVSDGTACPDGNQCTSQEHCVSGQCIVTLKNCNDGNSCTFDDSCSPATGQCMSRPSPDGTPCDDGNACTPSDQCMNTQCIGGGPPPTCADNNACTQDSCDPATGACRFLPLVCGDENPCTQDSCDPAAGCRYDALPNGAACDDGNACILGESCQYGQCVGAPKSCDDGAATCTYDYCDPQTGQCLHYPQCNDGNPCTDDICEPGGGCSYLPRAPGSACDDGNSCSTQDTCVDSGMGWIQCVGTATPGAACNDSNPCTTDDLCIEAGASFAYCQGTEISCADGELCNIDYCDTTTGQCVHQPRSCDDGNFCTIDSCGPQEGQCSYQPVAAGTPCSDACLIGATCGPGPKGFACNGTPNIGAACNDNNSCTETDSCRSDGRGGTFCGGNGIVCNDGQVCTYEFCDAAIGQCRVFPNTCNDGDPCTLDQCDSGTGTCSNQPGSLYEVLSLSAVSNTSITWSPTPPPAHWNSYRGTIPASMLGSRPPGSAYDHACYESADAGGDGALVSGDGSIPPPGTAYYYDATGEYACGEGPLGKDSAGAVRPNAAPCPTPP